MSVVFGLSIYMATGNNSTFGNENDLQGLLFGGWRGGENSNKKVHLWVIVEKMEICSYLHVGKINISQDVSYRLDNFKCLYSSWYEILLELREEGEWLGHVQCDMRHV